MSEYRVKPNWKMWLGLFSLAALLFVLWSGVSYLSLKAVDSYVECLDFPGAIVQESYPAVCYLPDGRSFTQPQTDDIFPPNDSEAGWPPSR